MRSICLVLYFMVLCVGCGGDSGESMMNSDLDALVTGDMMAPTQDMAPNSEDAEVPMPDAASTELDAAVVAGDMGAVEPDMSNPDAGTEDSDVGIVAEAPSLGTLVFQSGFEPDTVIETRTNQLDVISGIDGTVAEKGDWLNDLVANTPLISSAVINYEDSEGDRNKRAATLEREGGNTFLRYSLNETHVEIVSPHDPNRMERKGRIQLGLRNLQNYNEFTYRVKLRLGGAFEDIAATNQEISWMTLAEFWNDQSGAEFPFRIHISAKKSADDRYFYWGVTGEEKVRRMNGTSSWDELPGLHFPDPDNGSPKVRIPLNQWIELTVRGREGQGQDGRLVVTVRYPRRGEIVVADYTGSTVHPQLPASELDGFDSLHPLKLYTNGLILDELNRLDLGGLIVDWDDFELYEGFTY